MYLKRINFINGENMKKKILIIYASYGSGHKTVANYLYDYFLSTNKYDIRIIDILDYENIIGKISKKYLNKTLNTKVVSFLHQFTIYLILNQQLYCIKK